MPGPDLPPDAPLRHRLWFRIWRGWRKAMIGLVVLVAVAWGTRPGARQHTLALFDPLLQATLVAAGAGQIPADERRRFEQLVHSRRLQFAEGNIGTQHVKCYPIVDLWVLTTCRQFVPRAGRSILSIGAFGYVWVLD